jgi:hypothetical protein
MTHELQGSVSGLFNGRTLVGGKFAQGFELLWGHVPPPNAFTASSAVSSIYSAHGYS